MKDNKIAEYENSVTRFDIAYFDYQTCKSVLSAFDLIEDKCYITDGKPDRLKAEVVHNVKKDEYERCKDKKEEFEKDMVKFSIVVPFDEQRNVWLTERINPEKTFANYFTVPGGKLEEEESYEDAAIRESKEEANLKIEKKILKLVGEHKFFFDSKLHIGKIYTASIHLQIPVRNEPDNFGDWFTVPYLSIDEYKLTPGLNELVEDIKRIIKGTRISKSRCSDDTEVVDDELVCDDVVNGELVCGDTDVVNGDGKRVLNEDNIEDTKDKKRVKLG